MRERQPPRTDTDQELEDQGELPLRVHHVVEADDVGVLQLLKQGDLADGRRGDAWFFSCVYK